MGAVLFWPPFFQTAGVGHERRHHPHPRRRHDDRHGRCLAPGLHQEGRRHRHLSEDQAHKTMRQMAMNQNKRLIDVAEAVLAMADVLPVRGR